jgi:hypothetical protein
MNMTPAVERMLTQGEPWVAYNAAVDLFGERRDSAGARKAYEAMRRHPGVSALIDALKPWPPEQPLSRAYDPADSIWKLGTLADFGLRREDKRIAAIANRIFAAQSPDGGFLHGGFDHTHSWDARPYICISHVMTYALARFGYADDRRLDRAYEHIAAWQRDDGGWHPNAKCLPGAERESEHSCPFGTLNVLRALTAHASHARGRPAARGAGFLMTCWARRGEPFRPVRFGTGSTYLKVQYPFVQWQLLKALDTLSVVPGALKDARFLEMAAELKSKQGPDGTWTPESINKSWSAFDFGQKKEPSAWVTFLALRVLRRGGIDTAPAAGGAGPHATKAPARTPRKRAKK